MAARRTAMLVAIGATLAGCGGGNSDPEPVRTLEFEAVPSTATEGATMGLVRVTILSGGALDTTAANAVILSLGLSSPPGSLLGTTTRTAVAGVATFDDLVVSGGFGSGFTIHAQSAGISAVTSNPFVVTQGPSVQLAITSVAPAALAPFQGFDVTVEVRTAGNVRQEGASNVVTLALSGGGPDLFWHATGSAPRVVELLDPSTNTILPTALPTSVAGGVDGAVYDATTNVLDVSTESGTFFIAEPATGDEARWADTTTLSAGLKGLVFDAAGVLHGGNVANANHFTVDLESGVNTLVGPFTMTGFTLTGNNGLARSPITGTFFGVTKVTSGPRRLATLDLATGTFTDVGSLGDNFSAITFDPAGNLFGVTGNGATVPKTLYHLDPATAAKTLDMTLGHGGGGEVVVFVPRRLGGVLTASAVNGTATFHGLYINYPGTGYTLSATSPGLVAAQASGYAVSGAVTPTAIVEFETGGSLVQEDVAGGKAQVTLGLSTSQAHAVPVFLTIDTTSTATCGGATPDVRMRRAFQVIVPAGRASVTFDVPIVDDAQAEPDETLVMTIRSAHLAAGIGPTATHVRTIHSNE